MFAVAAAALVGIGKYLALTPLRDVVAGNYHFF